ncbi:hypothetical protein ACQZ6S_14745 [Agrobacterium tumefaciens]
MHVFNVRLDRVEPALTVLVAQVTGEYSIERMFELLYDAYPIQRAQASALILRPDVRDTFSAKALSNATSGIVDGHSPFLERIGMAHLDEQRSFARFSLLPVFVLHGDGDVVRLSENVNPLAEIPPDLRLHLQSAELVSDVRIAEMQFLIDTSGAVLPPLENSYYDNPSHRPARAFLRVGNIQYSRLAIDAVTFWMLPHVAHCEAILVDTWSLSSVAFNTSRVLAAIRNARPIPVEMLSQYQDNSAERRSALTEILQRLLADAPHAPAGEKLRVLCIVSVTHTGSLVKVLREQVRLSGLPIKLEFVALFRLGPGSEPDALCDLSDVPHFQPLSEVEIHDRSAIPIHEKIYFPVTYKDIEHQLLLPQANRFRSFIETVRGRRVISVHRDQVDDGKPRHHAIHLDMERLFDIGSFRDSFAEQLLALDPPPSVILAPEHAAARKLSQLACDLFEEKRGPRPVLLHHANLDLKETGLLAADDIRIQDKLVGTDPAEAILILDDCFITGARLSAYQTRLRQRNVKAKLHYMVAVARPEDPAAWTDFKKKLSFRAVEDRTHHSGNTVSCVFEVILPNWQHDRCPWCQERLLYERLESEGNDLPERFRNRRLSLADRDLGLEDSIFLDPETSEIKLYPGSIFAPQEANQAEVFAAIAAAIQCLRVCDIQNKPRLGARRHPIATVLDQKTYLSLTYTDTVIRASFLRGATWEELVYTDRKSEGARSDLIATIIGRTENDESNLTLELVLAAASGKCTVPADAVNLQTDRDILSFFQMTQP